MLTLDEVVKIGELHYKKIPLVVRQFLDKHSVAYADMDDLDEHLYSVYDIEEGEMWKDGNWDKDMVEIEEFIKELITALNFQGCSYFRITEI